MKNRNTFTHIIVILFIEIVLNLSWGLRFNITATMLLRKYEAKRFWLYRFGMGLVFIFAAGFINSGYLSLWVLPLLISSINIRNSIIRSVLLIFVYLIIEIVNTGKLSPVNMVGILLTIWSLYYKSVRTNDS